MTEQTAPATPAKEVVRPRLVVDRSDPEQGPSAVITGVGPDGREIVAILTDDTILDAIVEGDYSIVGEDGKEELGPTGGDDDPNLWADVQASRFLRAHHAIGKRIATTKAQLEAEVAFITRRFERIIASEERALEGVESALLILASSVTFPKGKKSRKVGYGSYGLRTVPAQGPKLDIADQEALVKWLDEFAPDLVTREQIVKVTVDKKLIAAKAEESGLIPDGVTLIPTAPERQALKITVAVGPEAGA